MPWNTTYILPLDQLEICESSDIGNHYKAVGFGFGSDIVGQIKSESIYPGQSVDDLLIFEVQVGAAKYLKLELPASNVGETGTIRLRIRREFWSTATEKPKE
jgi:hypothetical protein